MVDLMDLQMLLLIVLIKRLIIPGSLIYQRDQQFYPGLSDNHPTTTKNRIL